MYVNIIYIYINVPSINQIRQDQIPQPIPGGQRSLALVELVPCSSGPPERPKKNLEIFGNPSRSCGPKEGTMEILWNTMEILWNPMEDYTMKYYGILQLWNTMKYLKCFLTLKLQTRLNTIDNIVGGDAQ
jgi:hypothetical protein